MKDMEARLAALFGTEARVAGPLAASGAVLRVTGIELCAPLSV